MVFICDQCGMMFDTEKALVQSHINPFHLLPEIMSSVKRKVLPHKDSNISLDGNHNSLFKSFAEQLHLNNISSLDPNQLRVQAVSSLKETPQVLVNGKGYDLSMFITEGSWEGYLLRMSEAQTDGDHVILQRLCHIYNVHVEIIIEGMPTMMIEPLTRKDLSCIVMLALDSNNNFTSIKPDQSRNKVAIPLTKTQTFPFDVQNIQATLELRDSAETEAVTVLTNLGIQRNSKDVPHVPDKYDKKLPKKKQPKTKQSKKLKIRISSPVVGNDAMCTDFHNHKLLKEKEKKGICNERRQSSHIEPKIDLFQNDEAMPYFQKGNSRGMTAFNVVRILLDKHPVTCSKRPFSCKENAAFLVTLSSTCLFEDITYDDMTWISSGRRTSGLVLNKNGDMYECVKVLPKTSNTDFTLTRIYRKNSSNENFRCIISHVKEYNAIVNNLVLIQYYFIGPPTLFTVRPHGNSKSIASFKPTKPSTKRLLKEMLQVEPPSEAIRHVRRIIKGKADRKNANCDLPLGKQQAYDMNRRKRRKTISKI
ncbi:uncharacterized protein LOC117124081 isoform X2 [Anneissia japonica]|uniref:uncharacterized protein LOC117124081 isoform X2 n=1 Tax=Anneissia japonica TaxID=1529436 RepID=UPI0014256576|nr:uncharacterized protein LOC117124081 isoform X2 [Anneissia japonica]